MSNGWESLTAEQKEAAIRAYENSLKTEVPIWYEGGKLNEVMYVEALLKDMPLFCVNGRLYMKDGTPVNEDHLASRIINQLSGYLTVGLI